MLNTYTQDNVMWMLNVYIYVGSINNMLNPLPLLTLPCNSYRLESLVLRCWLCFGVVSYPCVLFEIGVISNPGEWQDIPYNANSLHSIQFNSGYRMGIIGLELLTTIYQETDNPH